MEEEFTQSKALKQANLEKMSKEEIIVKYKNVLGILKKAKVAKDDAIADIDKLRSERVKVIREFEEERNKAAKEADALQEMVTSFTENKITLITKNESLQRQLNLQLNEVDCMKKIEKALLEEREDLIKETDKLKKLLVEQQNVVKKIKNEKESANTLSSQLWEREREELYDKVESLEAQISQTRILKTEFKKMEEEKRILLANLNEAEEMRKVLVEDKKAMEIVHNELKSQKIIVDERFKTCEREREEWRNKASELKFIQEKLCAAEEGVKHYKQEFQASNSSQIELKSKYEVSVEEIKMLEVELGDLKKQHSDLIALHQESQDDLKSLSATQEHLKHELEEKKLSCSESTKKIEALEGQIKDLISHHSVNDLELKSICDHLQSENKTHLNSVEKLNAEIDDLKKFYYSVQETIKSEDHQITKKDIIVEIQRMKSQTNEATISYDTLKENTLELIGLVKCLFPENIYNSEDWETEDTLARVKLLIQSLKMVNEELRKSAFEKLCNKCSSDIEEFCQDVQKIETLLSNLNSSDVPFEPIDKLLSEEIVVKPILSLMANLLSIYAITSRLLGISSITEMSCGIGLAHNKIETLKHLTLNYIQNIVISKTAAQKSKSMMEMQKETIQTQKLKIEEQIHIILSFDSDLKALKQKYNEIEQTKHLQELNLLDLTNEYKEVKELQKQEKDRFKEKIAELESQLKASPEVMKENQMLQEKISLESQMMNAFKDNESIKSESTNLTTELTSLFKENELLKEEIVSVRNELKEAFISKEANIGDTEKAKTSLESVINKNESLQSKGPFIKNELVESVKFEESQAGNTDKIKSDLESALKANESLKEELFSLESKLVDSYNLIESQSQVENMKTDLEALTQANKLLTGELLSVKDELAKYVVCDNSCHIEMEKIKANLESVIKENILLKEETSSAKIELAEALKYRDLQNRETGRVKAELDLSVKANESLISDLSSLESQLTDSDRLGESQYTEMESMRTDLESLTKANKLLSEELLSVKDELTKYVNNNELHCHELEKIRAIFESKIKENALLKEEISVTKNKLTESINYGKLQTKEADKTKIKLESAMKDSESQKEEVLSLKNKMAQSIEVCQSHVKEIESMRTDIESLTSSNEILNKELLSVKDELGKYVPCDELCFGEVEKIKKQLQAALEEKEYLEKSVKTLQSELADSVRCQEDFRELLQKSKLKLQDLKIESESLEANVKATESKVPGYEESISEVCIFVSLEDEKERISCQQEISINAKTAEPDKGAEESLGDESLRYREIILELNEMNQIIRKRGERISLLEDKIQKQNCEKEALTMQLSELQTKLSSGEKLLASKQEELEKIQSSTLAKEPSTVPLEEKIQTLEKENVELKKMLRNEAALKDTHILCPLDTQSETMSTSTISKLEDTQRMKELEDTFEERYMKLKSVAIQLKKKLAEQTSKIKALEESKQKLLTEKEDAAKKGSGLASRNIQVLQNEIDRLQDCLDANANEMRERERQLVVSAQECSDLKSKCVDIEEENLELNQKIKNLEETLLCREKLIKNLEEQVCTLEMKLRSEEEKIASLQNEQKLGEERSELEKKNRDHLLRELEEAKQESKKHSLLDLEMKDYERSIEELTLQVKEKNEMISDATSRLENEEKKSEALKEEIVLLRDQIESETDRAEKLRKSVSDYKRQLSDVRQNQEKQMQEKEKEKITNEKLIQELEEQKLALADLSAHSTQTEAKLRKEIEISKEKVDILEEQLRKNEKTTEKLHLELESLRKEYDAYKIRAQSVLRQKGKVPQENYEQVKTEREQLSASLEAAQIMTHQLQSELAAAKESIMLLSSEKERLSSHVRAISSGVSKQELAHQEQIISLEKKLETKIAEYQLVISTMSSQNEAMIKSYKTQLDSHKENYWREIKKLEGKLEESDEEIWRLKNTSKVTTSTSSCTGKGIGKQEQEPAGGVSPLATLQIRKAIQGGGGAEEHRIDFTNMIREEGEGSEWVEPHSHHRFPSQQLYKPPSLEQLINSPFPPQQQPMDESSSVVSAATEYSNKEIAKLESKLSVCEVRIQQLTTLLTETESENAKLIQLSDTLKDDIRRTARNEKREKHLENNEYIKNVILKFLHLKTGDERYRLVPVLKTLLQLSPEETARLAVIAKGEDTQGLPQGWNNYLHLWSGR